MSSPRASVIIPTYNKARYLDRTLASWLRQDSDDYEIVVIDDGSADETRDVLRGYERRLPLRHRSYPNGGRSAARNRALELAQGEIIIFSDDDRVVEPGFVRAHVRAFDGTSENLVILGMQYGLLSDVRSQEGLRPSAVLKLASANAIWKEALIEGRSFETISAHEIEADFARTIELLRIPEPWFYRIIEIVRLHGNDITGFSLAWSLGATGNMGVRAESLRAAGHFDENFRGWGLEDFELHYRLHRMGARTRFCAAAVNYHQNHARKFAELDEGFRRNLRVFIAKHQAIEPLLFFLHSRGFLSLIDAEQMGSELASMDGTVLARAVPDFLRAFLQRG
jgi:glycosyltransferase involved in cell wall biosynthesis